MCTLTWLDFSDAERKRASHVVELLGRPETRDELGLKPEGRGSESRRAIQNPPLARGVLVF